MSAHGKARILVVALDAADPVLVREMAASGDMPNVAALLAASAAVRTMAPEGVFVSANWPTVFTALRPDRHRYLCWDTIRPGTYDYDQTTPEEVQGTPFWETLSQAGRRVGLFDVPHTVARPLHGAMVAEWGCHDRHFGPSSWPPELVGELTAAHGRHFGAAPGPVNPQHAPCDYVHREGERRTTAEDEALFALLVEGVEQKRRASLDLLDRGGWDLFLTVFGESHCVGHQLWHLHDADHPFHDAACAARLEGDPVRAIYRRLDAALGDHLARLGEDDTVYLLLAHGMTAHHDGTHLLDQVLDRLDWSLDHPAGLGGATRAAGALADALPRGLRREALRRAAPLVRRRAGDGTPAPAPPRSERRWFLTPNNTVVGSVRLNLAGREPAGRILPADRREVLRWLSDRLEELVNVDTGGRAVVRCELSEDVYRRDDGDAMGDLFVEWERSAPIERVWSPAVGTVAVPYDHWRQGDHERGGLLLARGPGIVPGLRPGVAGTHDLGATFAAAAGVSLEGVDGRAIGSVLPGAGAPPARAPTLAAARLRARAGALLRRRAVRRVPAWSSRQDPSVHRLRRDLDGVAAGGMQTAALAHAAAAAIQPAVDAATGPLRERLHPLERNDAVWTMRSWLPHAEVPESLPITVVLPTRNRCDLLPAAVDSVLAQTYGGWELLIVDDGSADGTAGFLAGLTDPRIRVLRTDGVGVCAARNLALDAASGEVLTYLDDDNRFDPDWLKAVALAFSAFPDHRAAYGARIVDDHAEVVAGAPRGRPWVHFTEWDGDAVLLGNRVDMGALAHRRGAARFDPELAFFGDWDLLLQLTSGAEPLEIPAIAVHYSTKSPDRLTSTLSEDEIDAEFRRVRGRLTGV